jgi:hypothetical protein
VLGESRVDGPDPGTERRLRCEGPSFRLQWSPPEPQYQQFDRAKRLADLPADGVATQCCPYELLGATSSDGDELSAQKPQSAIDVRKHSMYELGRPTVRV